MNRPGQPQQRPPSLTQNPSLNTPFRAAFPPYGMQPRSVNTLPGSGYVTGIQSNTHRAPTQPTQVQSLASQSSPGFLQQRVQSSFTFTGGLGQHQSSTTLQQQQQSTSHQQQTNGTTTPLPPHLSQTPNIPSAQSVSSSNDVGLDPNDFPALGSTPGTTTSAGSNGTTTSGTTTSYASQAGTGVPLTGTGTIAGQAGGSTPHTRDFTPDDFPALGGQSQSQSQNGQTQNSSQDSQAHPPGLNGFQHSDPSQQHRQSLLGALGGNLQPGTPGMLNLWQSRSVHSGFQQGQSEAEKQQQRNYAVKLNQVHAWNSPNANPGSQSQGTDSLGGYTNSQTSTQPQQNGSQSNPPANTTNISAPPGVSLPYSATPSGQPQYPSNGTVRESDAPRPNTTTASIPHPQTPAQQVLVSAADRWGLLGLLAMLKNVGPDLDQGMSGIGTDLGTMGLDMGSNGDLYSTFITPWADQSAARTVEPDFHLPSCYASVSAPPPGPTKAAAFSDETLFFMFYSSPRDALQEVSAQELWNRNWRYHKDLRLWITKENGTSPSQKIPGGEQGQYTFWDPENWCKERKDMTVLYADLEEKSAPAFVQGPGLVLMSAAAQAVQGQGVVQTTQRGSFQMGMVGL